MTLTTHPAPPPRGTDLQPPQGEKDGTAPHAGHPPRRPPATPTTARTTTQLPPQPPALLLAGEDQDDADPHIVRGID